MVQAKIKTSFECRWVDERKARAFVPAYIFAHMLSGASARVCGSGTPLAGDRCSFQSILAPVSHVQVGLQMRWNARKSLCTICICKPNYMCRALAIGMRLLTHTMQHTKCMAFFQSRQECAASLCHPPRAPHAARLDAAHYPAPQKEETLHIKKVDAGFVLPIILHSTNKQTH